MNSVNMSELCDACELCVLGSVLVMKERQPPVITDYNDRLSRTV
jgi:hypothetical protein